MSTRERLTKRVLSISNVAAIILRVLTRPALSACVASIIFSENCHSYFHYNGHVQRSLKALKRVKPSLLYLQKPLEAEPCKVFDRLGPVTSDVQPKARRLALLPEAAIIL